MERSDVLFLWANPLRSAEIIEAMKSQQTVELKLVKACRMVNGDYYFEAESPITVHGQVTSIYNAVVDDALPLGISLILNGDGLGFAGASSGFDSLHVSFSMDGEIGVLSYSRFYDRSNDEYAEGRNYRWMFDEGVHEDEAQERRNFLAMLEQAKKLK